MPFILQRPRPRFDGLDILTFIVEVGSFNHGSPFPRRPEEIGLRDDAGRVYPVHHQDLEASEWACSANLVTLLESVVIVTQRQLLALYGIIPEVGASIDDVENLSRLAQGREVILPRLSSLPSLYSGFSGLRRESTPAWHMRAIDEWIVMVSEVRQFADDFGALVWRQDPAGDGSRSIHFELVSRFDLNSTVAYRAREARFAHVWCEQTRRVYNTRPELLARELQLYAWRDYDPQPTYPTTLSTRQGARAPEGENTDPSLYNDSELGVFLDGSWIIGPQSVRNPPLVQPTVGTEPANDE